MSLKFSLETEIAFFIDKYNAMPNINAKLECFSGHCHIAPAQLGLVWLFPVWTILCAQH